MPTTKRVARKTPRKKTPIEAIRQAFQGWIDARFEADMASARQTELRDMLKAEIENQGYADEKGSQYLDLGEAVRGRKLNSKGQVMEIAVETLKNERRVTQVLNEDKAEKLLKDKGLLDEGTVLVLRVQDQEAAIAALQKARLLDDDAFSVERQLDEERILALRFEERLSQEDIDAIFDVKETFAFKPLEV